MSLRFTSANVISTDYVSDKLTQIFDASIECDTYADLPAMNYVDTETGSITLAMGSRAHVIETNKEYKLQSDGTWTEQLPEQANYFYTKEDIDNMIEDIDTDIGNVEDDLSDEVTARQNADAALEDVLENVINTGAKNLCPVNSGSNTLPTRWLQISITLEPGTYRFYCGTLSSDDTDASTCQVVGFDSANAQATNYIYPTRGSDVSVDLTVTATTSYIRIYPSDTYAHSENDTVTVSNLMICRKSDWNISQTYEPYCPTVRELYNTQYVHDSIQVNLNDITWTQSGGGLYYSQTIQLPDINLLYSVCLSGFASLRATDVIQAACRRSGGWSGFVLYANTNSFNSGAWVTVSGIGTRA